MPSVSWMSAVVERPTSVRTNKPRIFSRREIGVDALLASACLPNIFKAVEIDGGDLPHRVVELVDDVRGTGTLLRLIELDDVVGPVAGQVGQHVLDPAPVVMGVAVDE